MSLTYKKQLEANITNTILLVAFRNFIVFAAIIVPFFTNLNLDLFQIFIIESAFALTVLLTEIPSGFIADKFGRRKTIIIGTFSGFIGMIIYSLSSSFEFFIISEILIGIACSFISGSDSAIMYDSLKELKREEEYKKIEGKKEAVRTTMIGIAALLSGVAVIFSIRYAFYITTIFAFLSFIFALKLKETKRNEMQVANEKFFDILKETIKTKDIMIMILFSATIYGLSNLHFLSSQNFLQIINFPLAYFGVLFAIANFAVAFMTMFAYKVEEKIGLIKSMILTSFFVGISFFIFGAFNTVIGIVGIYTFQFARGIRTPIVRDFVNKRVKSSRRATVMSFDGFFGRGLFVLISPILGFLIITNNFMIINIGFGIILFVLMTLLTISLKLNTKISV
jgi:MFS family permease